MTHTALIIDDEADIRALIALSLDRIGLNTHTASNLAEARNLLDAYSFDVCLTDMRLPDGNGVDFVKYVHSIQPDLPVAVITAHGNMNAAVEAMKNGAFDFVSKPVDINLLRQLVTQAVASNSGDKHEQGTETSADIECAISLAELSQRSTPAATVPLLRGGEKLIGKSEPMAQLRTMILKAARTNAPVCITGESGTGKELVARLIHDNSTRANSPFVAINCGAIPSELMESEMFGHLKGSFTGAHTNHDGLFKRATGGTLFLDEVAELPLHMQVKLLRAVQERSIRPVGSSDEILTNVRILSASHKDLADEVAAGRFRHDLYYRLNVICLATPGLRDRRGDVIEIAHHILNSLSATSGRNQPFHLTTEAEQRLAQYTFPGNVRELENILERAVAMADTPLIDVDGLALNQNTAETARYEGADNQTNIAPSSEKARILEALSQNRWNRKATAMQLGLSYRQLRYRIQQYEIDLPDVGT